MNKHRYCHASRAKFTRHATAARRARRSVPSNVIPCVDCGKAALTKPDGQPAFPVARCVPCACAVYAQVVGWTGEPAAVETRMIADPDVRAILSRPAVRQ
jgi:hypothetical protein